MRSFHVLSLPIILLAVALTACKDNDSKKGISVASKADDPVYVSGGSVAVAAPTDAEKKAIENCSKAWGQSPPGNFNSVRKILAQVSVLGAGATLKDDRVTSSPELTLIVASVNVLGTPKWELSNPNGWYCMVTNVNVLSSLTITIDKSSHLADSAVQVDVLSKNEGNASAVGVNVLSHVKVIKK